MRLSQPAPGKRESAQSRHSLRFDSFGRDQHVEAFSHSGWSYQVLQLQRDFGALLRQAAVCEHIGKLIGLADSH